MNPIQIMPIIHSQTVRSAKGDLFCYYWVYYIWPNSYFRVYIHNGYVGPLWFAWDLWIQPNYCTLLFHSEFPLPIFTHACKAETHKFVCVCVIALFSISVCSWFIFLVPFYLLGTTHDFISTWCAIERWEASIWTLEYFECLFCFHRFLLYLQSWPTITPHTK